MIDWKCDEADACYFRRMLTHAAGKIFDCIAFTAPGIKQRVVESLVMVVRRDTLVMNVQTILTMLCFNHFYGTSVMTVLPCLSET